MNIENIDSGTPDSSPSADMILEDKNGLTTKGHELFTSAIVFGGIVALATSLLTENRPDLVYLSYVLGMVFVLSLPMLAKKLNTFGVI